MRLTVQVNAIDRFFGGSREVAKVCTFCVGSDTTEGLHNGGTEAGRLVASVPTLRSGESRGRGTKDFGGDSRAVFWSR